MLINPYTKEAYDFSPIDLCDNRLINPKVKNLYEKHKGTCERYLTSVFSADSKIHRYYVYSWFTKAEPKRYFYVGKGAGKRWQHIISDINKYKNGKHNIRFQRYSQIEEHCGIDHEILIDGLTEYEALIYEECQKLEYLKNGEILLNIEGIPSEYALHDWEGERAATPSLQKSPFFTRYLEDLGNPYFDLVTGEDLTRTYIYPYFVDEFNPKVIEDKAIITKWLEVNGAKVYRAISTRTKSVIVQGVLRYDRYVEYRNKGMKIFSSKDVISYIVSRHTAK
ncbi:MAG: hypothetical protein IKN55_11285 [Oscillospiraceae bacterium]|nr:hypothetical protein [Oscillospiraceae bacterium]